jgi:hypothetical protein
MIALDPNNKRATLRVDAQGRLQTVGTSAYTVGTWATIRALTPAQGDRAFATDLGNGCAFVYNGTRWVPQGPQLIAFNDALVTGTQTTPMQVLRSLTIQQGLLQVGAKVRVEFGIGKSGATDALATAAVYYGTLGTTSDVQIGVTGAATWLASAKRSSGLAVEFTVLDATHLVRNGTGGGIDNGSFNEMSNNATAQASATVASNLTQATKLSVAANMSAATADSPQAYDVRVWMIA